MEGQEARMGGKILAVMENSIGPRLLLSTRLGGIGYAVTVVSTGDAAAHRMAEEAFEWIILDEAVVGARRRQLFRHLASERPKPRIVWLGGPPSKPHAPIEAVFPKPLDYDRIVRFFRARVSRGRGRPVVHA
jgi:CheY-like chemotaxis protein